MPAAVKSSHVNCVAVFCTYWFENGICLRVCVCLLIMRKLISVLLLSVRFRAANGNKYL